MELRLAIRTLMGRPLLVIAVLAAAVAGCAGGNSGSSVPSVTSIPAAPAATDASASAGSVDPSPSVVAAPTASTAAMPRWNPDACPDGASGGHSDWIEEFAFDTPEEAAREQPPEAPPGERIQVQAGGDRQVWVVVDDTGAVVAQLEPERRSDGKWAVYDYAWCWGTSSDPSEGDTPPYQMDTVEVTGGACLVPEPGRHFFADEISAELAELDLGHGPFVAATGHAGEVVAAGIPDGEGVVDIGAWYYDEIEMWAMDDTASSTTSFPLADDAVLARDELAELVDLARDCARTVVESGS